MQLEVIRQPYYLFWNYKNTHKNYFILGFSGKKFLNTVEYLDSQSNEWTTFVPQKSSDQPKGDLDLKQLKGIMDNLKLESRDNVEDNDDVFFQDPNHTNGHHDAQEVKEKAEENSTNSIVNDTLSAVKTNKTFFSNNSSDKLKQEQHVVSTKNTINDDDEDIPLMIN